MKYRPVCNSLFAGFPGFGSGVRVKSRLRSYSSKDITGWKCSLFHVIAEEAHRPKVRCARVRIIMATSVWKGHLTFGLVSLPVKLFTAARSETLSFNQLHKHDNSRIKQVIYCQAEDKPIPRDEIVKGFEYEKGK